MKFSELLKRWNIAAEDLELELIAPYSLELSNGSKLDAIFLIKYFGATNGMLVFGNYNEISSYVDEIVGVGFGYTILDEPMEEEKYSREIYIDMLKDWGWTGESSLKPNWL